MSADEREAVDRLDAYLDGLASGSPVPELAVDPQWVAIDRHLRALDRTPAPPPAFAARLLEELMATHAYPNAHSLRSLPHVNGRARPPGTDIPRTLPASARRWVPTQLATAALLLLIIVGSVFAFGPSRAGRQGQLPAILPAVSGTPDTPESVVVATLLQDTVTEETLLHDTVAGMPTGAAGLWVNAYVMQPGAVSPRNGAVGALVFTVVQGTVTIRVSDDERMLGTGESWSVLTQTGYTIENTGSDEAHLVFVEIIDTVRSFTVATPDGPFIDELSGTWETWIQAAPTLSGSPGQVMLKRLTFAPGAALPTYTQSGLDWLGVGGGRLTVRLEGEQLPFRWKSGAERSFGLRQIPPVFPDGTRVTLRNADDDPLILYRLTITPSGTDAASSGTPTDGTPTR